MFSIYVCLHVEGPTSVEDHSFIVSIPSTVTRQAFKLSSMGPLQWPRTYSVLIGKCHKDRRSMNRVFAVGSENPFAVDAE